MIELLIYLIFCCFFKLFKYDFCVNKHILKFVLLVPFYITLFQGNKQGKGIN